MIVFEFETDQGHTRDIFWLGTTSVTGADGSESDNIYEQLACEETGLVNYE